MTINGSESGKDHLDCAVEMLQRLKAGQTPTEINKGLKRAGYSQQQIKEAGDALVKSL